ncbi:MAG: FAD-dependent oxidoreductase [Gemmatimonadota bacterium]
MASADVCIVGGGVIGRCAALELIQRGVRVALVSMDLPGTSSRAAAGLLAPSIEGGSGPAYDFAIAARDLYPSFLEGLTSRVGGEIEFSRDGILDVATDEASEVRLRERAAALRKAYLAPNEVADLEPALVPSRGGLLAQLDGYVDNVALMDALEKATRSAGTRLREMPAVVSRVELHGDSASVVLDGGERVGCGGVVLAGGARSASIAGLPRPLPVHPLKGQMIRYEPPAIGLRRAVYGAGVYLVPRGGSAILVGATSEDVGFDLALTEKAGMELSTGAKTLLPSLDSLKAVDQWTGLRPMTPDSLPILGTDPEVSSLIYACGHSRNGILKAPITGECVADLCVGENARWDLSPFSVARFETPHAR